MGWASASDNWVFRFGPQKLPEIRTGLHPDFRHFQISGRPVFKHSLYLSMLCRFLQGIWVLLVKEPLHHFHWDTSPLKTFLICLALKYNKKIMPKML